MAKAVFQRNQKVWVESVDCWAVIERIVPIWADGFSEPVRITYDVGLGRGFLANELKAEDRPGDGIAGGHWRLLRAKNKWQEPGDCAHHPYPGTYPVVVTDENDWGGWRVPGAEYDRDPRKIEYQARLIAAAPQLLAIAKDLIDLVAEEPSDAPGPVASIAGRAVVLARYLEEIPAGSPEAAAQAAE